MKAAGWPNRLHAQLSSAFVLFLHPTPTPAHSTARTSPHTVLRTVINKYTCKSPSGRGAPVVVADAGQNTSRRNRWPHGGQGTRRHAQRGEAPIHAGDGIAYDGVSAKLMQDCRGLAHPRWSPPRRRHRGPPPLLLTLPPALLAGFCCCCFARPSSLEFADVATRSLLKASLCSNRWSKMFSHDSCIFCGRSAAGCCGIDKFRMSGGFQSKTAATAPLAFVNLQQPLVLPGVRRDAGRVRLGHAKSATARAACS
ncbi:uncharacterized protein Tco025E_01548 [Trypanosoma conorhini]|uniref:Uncharacterized protein n=1 Tax=Trypanosoma conorhini TaxID=83891 RepID=A0A422Q8U1_9TRYP|nr:uncharacterized protein Tco025E_01548 [Trypanosoma conorhini]RNF26347.1 hypothetical protein Tco025E_01548 [Trypanosoma conorhini]